MTTTARKEALKKLLDSTLDKMIASINLSKEALDALNSSTPIKLRETKPYIPEPLAIPGDAIPQVFVSREFRVRADFGKSGRVVTLNAKSGSNFQELLASIPPEASGAYVVRETPEKLPFCTLPACEAVPAELADAWEKAEAEE